MEAVDIVEALNQYYERFDKKGQFILQKSAIPDATMKAYKKCNFTVWFVENKEKHRIATVNVVARIISDKDVTKVNNDMCIELTKTLFEYINSNEFTSLTYGI